MRQGFRICVRGNSRAGSRRIMKRKAEPAYRYLRVDTDNLRHELYVTAVGSLDTPAGGAYPAPDHPDGYLFDWARGRVLGDFAVVFLSRGGGVFETRNGRVACRAGDVLLIPPGVWHRYRPDPATGWCEHWVCANGEYLHRLRAKKLFLPNAEHLVGAADARLREAHRRLWRRAKSAGAANDLALAAGALEVFSLASAHRLVAVDFPLATAADPVAAAAREYLWFNSHRPLSVARIAAQVGVSRRTLERAYRDAHGITVANDLTARRVERARHLLEETRMSVKEISYAVGFGDPKRLIRNFTRATGSSPAAFRRRTERGAGS